MPELDGPDESESGQPLGPETATAFSLAGWTSMFGQNLWLLEKHTKNMY